MANICMFSYCIFIFLPLQNQGPGSPVIFQVYKIQGHPITVDYPIRVGTSLVLGRQRPI